MLFRSAKRSCSRLVDAKLRREHDLLAFDGWGRYQAFRRTHPGLAERVPLSQLATYLGLTDVSLSRLRGRCGVAVEGTGAGGA